MLRRDLLRAGAGVGLAGVAGCAAPGDGPAFAEGFEDGMGEWEADATIGPEVDLEKFEWVIGVSGPEASEGERSLRVWNEGDYDGVTWASHPVPVEPGRAYRIEATGQFWSDSESFNTIRHAVMRLGPEPASVEEDFPQLGVNSTEFDETPYGGLREPLWLVDGWREYRFQWTTRSSRPTRSTSPSAPPSSGRPTRHTTSTTCRSPSNRSDGAEASPGPRPDATPD